MNQDRESYTEAECEVAFGRLFPHGFSGPDVCKEFAFDKVVGIEGDDQDETERNIRELVGRCVWDIFSDQHDVIAPDARALHLGSHRMAGEFIADFLNRQTGRRQFDYMNFYMGTSAPWAAEGDFTSIYEWIFGRLKADGLDWVYQFPRIHLVDFRPLAEQLRREEKPDWENYSPSESLAKEMEDKQRDKEIAEFREQLEEDRNEAIAEALQQPAPAVVRAYRQVYGDWPEGWPPVPGA